MERDRRYTVRVDLRVIAHLIPTGHRLRLQVTSSSFPRLGGAAALTPFRPWVLQYLPRTLGELMSGYKRLPRRIVINTAAIHGEHEFFTVNSVGTAFCPYRIQTQAGLVRGLTALGYRLRETWINPGKPMTIPHRPEHSLGHYSGFCLDLNASA